MIRIVSGVSLIVVVIAVLYLPAAHPPQRFLGQLRTEHALNAQCWGNGYALQILARMLDFHDGWQQASPLPRTFTDAQGPTRVDAAVGVEITQITSRVTGNAYIRSLDALLALAAYRFAVLAQWLPCLLVVVIAAVFDGAMQRVIKAKEFLQHSAERYALYVCVAIVTTCATVIAFVVPVTVHPALLVTAPLWIGLCIGRALAHFHACG